MGFMDKAKKMAEQAQSKLDDAQKKFNEGQGSGDGQQQGGQAVEYDAHGRPVNAPQSAEAPPTPGEGSDPSTDLGTPTSPSPEPAKAEGDPLLADEPGSRQGADAEREAKPPADSNPGMTSGDPLG